MQKLGFLPPIHLIAKLQACAILLVMMHFGTQRALAQDSLRIGPKMELGIRSNEVIFSKQSFPTNSGGLENRRSFQSELECYGMWFDRRARFLRASVGFNHGDIDYESMDVTTGFSATRMQQSNSSELVSSLAVGKEFRPFKGRFASKFFVRMGLSLGHTYKLLSFSRIQSVFSDSLGNPETIRAAETKVSGLQSLQLKVFGQAGLQLWKGLVMNLEWQLGPKMDFGKLRIVESRYDMFPGQGQSFTSESRTRDTDLRLDFGNLQFVPYVGMGWRF